MNRASSGCQVISFSWWRTDHNVYTRTETPRILTQAIIICEEKGVAKKVLCDVTSVKCPICYNAIIFTILHLFGMRMLHITSHFVKDTSNGCWIIITSLDDTQCSLTIYNVTK